MALSRAAWHPGVHLLIHTVCAELLHVPGPVLSVDNTTGSTSHQSLVGGDANSSRPLPWLASGWILPMGTF